MAHWQTYGPLFRDLHLMFDEFAEAVLESLDEVAERVRMIGQDPPAMRRTVKTLRSEATQLRAIFSRSRSTALENAAKKGRTRNHE